MTSASASVTASHREPARIVKDLLFPRQPYLGSFFSTAPVKLGFGLAAFSILFLLLPALLAHVALIKDTLPQDWPWVGFWQRWNWALMYGVILPVIFAGMAALSRFTFAVLDSLTVGRSAPVKRHDGVPALDFAGAIACHASKHITRILWIAIALAVVLTAVDTRELLVGYYRYFTHQPHLFTDHDWSVAFELPQSRFDFYGFHPSGAVSNAGFDLLVYAVQTVIIFLGFFWVIVYGVILNEFSTQLIREGADFRFDPWWDDPEHRMGLLEVGRLFNAFLGLATLFEVFVLGHRLQLISRSGISLTSYAKEIITAPTNLQALWAHRSFDTCTPGMWLLLIFVLLPIVVIAWVPLIRFRKYLRATRRETYAPLREKLEAHARGTPEWWAARSLYDNVKKTEIWPNGDFAGWSFLFVMVVLAAASWFPPCLGYLVAGGGGLGLLYKVIRSFANKGASPAG